MEMRREVEVEEQEEQEQRVDSGEVREGEEPREDQPVRLN